MFLPCRPCCGDPCEFCRPAGETGDIDSITVTLSGSDYECSWNGLEIRVTYDVSPPESRNVYRTSRYLFPGSDYSGTFSLSPVVLFEGTPSEENAWQYDFSCGGFVRFRPERTDQKCPWLFAPRSRFAYAQSASSPPSAPSVDCSSTLVRMPASTYSLTQCGTQNKLIWSFADKPIIYYSGSFCEQGVFLDSTTITESLERVADCPAGSTTGCLYDNPFGIDTVLVIDNPTSSSGRDDIAGVAGRAATLGTCADTLPAEVVEGGETILTTSIGVSKASISESGSGLVYLTDVSVTYA